MNEVKNITDQYGNSQTYNAFKKILGKIFNITLSKQTPGPWERTSEPSDTGSSKELEPGHYMCCSTNHPISLGTFVPKADGGPRVCEMEAK